MNILDDLLIWYHYMKNRMSMCHLKFWLRVWILESVFKIWIWNLDLKLGFVICNSNLNLNFEFELLALKFRFGIRIWNLYLKFELEAFIWILDSWFEVGISNRKANLKVWFRMWIENFNSESVFEIWIWNLDLKLGVVIWI